MNHHTIQFTQEQARVLLGITPGTLRHWRKVVPYLANKKGKAARFSITDLVGLAIVGNLVNTYGVHITQIATGIDALFFQLRDRKWAFLQESVAVLTSSEGTLFIKDNLVGLQLDESLLVVPCKPIIQQIKDQVVPVTSQVAQQNLPFAPQVIEAFK